MTKQNTAPESGKSTRKRKGTGGAASPATRKGKKSPSQRATRAETGTSPPQGPVGSAPLATVAELSELYLSHLEEIGKSPSTLFSYRMDLSIARNHFGEGKLISEITTDQVAEFFDSPVVTEKKTGKPKSEVTIKKTRRVLRMALAWAAEKGMIEKAPIPRDR